MSEITREECACLDVEWYGVDRIGQIAVFCSGGEGSLPEFVCEDRERTDRLAEAFDDLPASSESCFLHEKGEQAQRVARAFSGKGLFYFDADDQSSPQIANLRPFYTKVSVPLRPLLYEELPEPVKTLLRHNRLEIDDFSKAGIITVKHTYESNTGE